MNERFVNFFALKDTFSVTTSCKYWRIQWMVELSLWHLHDKVLAFYPQDINSHEWSMVGCSLSLRDYFPFFKKLENILIMWYSDNNTGKQSLSRAVKINVSPFFRECKEDFVFNLKMKFMNLFLVNQGYQINISQRFWEPKMI